MTGVAGRRLRWAFPGLVAANGISGLGDQFNRVAVVTQVYMISGSGLDVGITLALRLVARLIVGPVGGIVADRFSRRKTMIISDIARAGVALIFLTLRTPSDLWVAYLAICLLESAAALFGPARSATISSLLPASSLAAGNSIDQTSTGLVMVVGSVLGGVAVAVSGATIAFEANSLSFVMSAAIVALVATPDFDADGRLGGSGTFGAVAQAIRAEPVLKWAVILAAVWAIPGGAISMLVATYGLKTFTAGDFGVGLLYGSLGLGFMCGAGSSRWLSRCTNGGIGVAAVAFVGEGVFNSSAAIAPGIWTAAVFLAVGAVFAGIGSSATITAVMKSAPPPMTGRVFGTIQTLSGVLVAGSMLATGTAVSIWSARAVGVCAGILLLLSGLILTAAVRGTKMDHIGFRDVTRMRDSRDAITDRVAADKE